MSNTPDISYEEFIKQQGQNVLPVNVKASVRDQQQQLIQQFSGNQQMQMQVPRSKDIMQDPFMMSQYNNVRIPDTPMNYSGGMADSLLNNQEVPEDIMKKFWYIFHKDNVLTFLDEPGMASKLLNMDIIKTDILTTTPYYDYDFEQELQFDILRNVFETKLNRAKGFIGTGQKNERVILQSQFSENRQINEMEGGDNRQGFFKRLLGRR